MIDRDRNSLTRTLTFLKEIFSALLLTSQVSTNLPSLSEMPHFSHCRVTVTNPLPFSLTACVCVCFLYVRGCVSVHLCVCVYTPRMACVFSSQWQHVFFLLLLFYDLLFFFKSHSYTLKRVVEGLPAELPWLLM